MNDIKFLAYLADEGLTLEQAQSVLPLLDDYIEKLEGLVEISSLVEKTQVTWQSAKDGELMPTAEITEKCMTAEDFKLLPARINDLATARALKKWIEKAIEYMASVTACDYVTLPPANELKSIYDTYNCIQANNYLRELLFPLLPPPPKFEKNEDVVITEDDYMSSLTQNNLVNFYSAQAAAATIGEYIHKERFYDRARIELVQAYSQPAAVAGSMEYPHVDTKVPAYSIEEVDKMYFSLQALQRDKQKEVNSVKYKAESAINESDRNYYDNNKQIDMDNQLKLSQYASEINALIQHINAEAASKRIAVPAQAKKLLESILKTQRHA